jgi:hypothetical protein
MADRSSFHKQEFGVLKFSISVVRFVTWSTGGKFPLLLSVGTMLYRRRHTSRTWQGPPVQPAEDIAR